MKDSFTKFIFQHWNLISSIIFVIGGIWILVSAGNQNRLDSKDKTLPQKGFLAPDFELTSLDEQKIKLSQYRGTPVIINFWATWCQPCRLEMPAIQNAVNSYSNKEIVILAVNMTAQDDETKVRDFVNELGLTFPILVDPQGEANSQYQISALPTTYFIQPDGIINEIIIGGPMAEALILTRIEKLLNQR